MDDTKNQYDSVCLRQVFFRLHRPAFLLHSQVALLSSGSAKATTSVNSHGGGKGLDVQCYHILSTPD